MCVSMVRCQFLKFRDPLQYPLLDKSNIFSNISDGWSISHLILFLLLANIYPKEIMFLILIGILWELFELFLGKSELFGFSSLTNSKILKKIGNNSKCKIMTDEHQSWWYAKWTDIILNNLGCLIGYYLYKKSIMRITMNPYLFFIIYSIALSGSIITYNLMI